MIVKKCSLQYKSATVNIRIEHQGKSLVVFSHGERIGSFSLVDMWDLIVDSLESIDGEVNKDKETALARRVYQALNSNRLANEYFNIQESE